MEMKMLINGQMVASDKWVDVLNPATEEVFAKVPHATEAQLDEAVAAAAVAQKAWENAGKKDVIDEAREKVDQILKDHKPLPLADEIQDELNWIYKKAQEEAG